MAAYVSSQSSNRSHLQPTNPSASNPNATGNGNGNGNGNSTEHSPHRLSPQEAALRGASLAFQKQKQQQQQHEQDPRIGQRKPSLTSSQLGRQATGGTGGISRQTTGSSSILGDAAERERERQALFLSSDLGRGSHLLLPPGGGKPTDSKSASFIAATLAASRSASPGSVPPTPGIGTNITGNDHANRTRNRSRGSVVDRPAHSSADDLTDTASLPPTTSLISMFEKKTEVVPDPVKSSQERHVERKLKRSSVPDVRLQKGFKDLNLTEGESQGNTRSRPHMPDTKHSNESEDVHEKPDRPVPKPKPGTKPKTMAGPRSQTPPPIARRVNAEIISPKPRKPDLAPKLEITAPSSEQSGSTESIAKQPKSKPAPPKPRAMVPSPDQSKIDPPVLRYRDNQTTQQDISALPDTTTSTPTKARPQAPRKRSELSGRASLELKAEGAQKRSVIANSDGQDEPRLTTASGRPSTAESKSSNDSFVSASSAPTRGEADSILTIEPPTPISTTPKVRPTHPLSSQPSMATLPIRHSTTGSSQLPIDSLSDAIMAGSLASAKHTQASATGARTPPPAPPTRRKGITKHKTGSGRTSPHRMKQTLRQPVSKSDDEETRKPHHHKKGLNHKKHAHHEGSRSRWREEITEREKKRYEAVWASNRGLFLVESLQQIDMGERHSRRGQPLVRNESYEEASEHVANVVVRDIWVRSRLPEAELAEVWDLVYGHGPRAPAVDAALGRQEFVVGMWLIDQRLRGRKIPPRVSESVWDSAKGLRVLTPGISGHKGKGKAK